MSEHLEMDDGKWHSVPDFVSNVLFRGSTERFVVMLPLTDSTTTLPMWWSMANQSILAYGIQQDRKTMTAFALCHTHRRCVPSRSLLPLPYTQQIGDEIWIVATYRMPLFFTGCVLNMLFFGEPGILRECSCKGWCESKRQSLHCHILYPMYFSDWKWSFNMDFLCFLASVVPWGAASLS